LNYSNYKDATPNTNLEANEDYSKMIKEIEELTNFNIKKNICLNCFEQLIKEREYSAYNLERESEALNQALVKLTTESETRAFSEIIKFSEEDLKKTEEIEVQKLEKLKVKEKETEEEIRSLYSELRLLCDQENNYWEEFNNLEKNILLYEKEKNIIKRKKTILDKEIKHLSATNILNELFFYFL